MPVSIHPHPLTIFALSLLAACGQATSHGAMKFKCESPSPPFDKGETHTVEFNPGSNQVEVGQYQYREETVSQDKRNQGWRRWSTNSDRYGKVNSWNELNIKTGELRYIGMNGQIKFRSSCSQVN